MSDLSQNFSHVLVDGGLVIVPSEKGWELLRHRGTFQNRSIYPAFANRMSLWRFNFVGDHANEFELGLYLPGSSAPRWLLLVLFKKDSGELQRVHLERVTCSKCGAQHVIANPTLVDLYLGVTNRVEANNRAFRWPRVRCPNCGAELPRFAIWAEPLTRKKN